KIKMDGNKIIDYITIRKVDQKLYPFSQVTQENEVLPGFVWRPQDRPKSKEDMMNRKREVEKPAAPTESAADESSGITDDMAEDFEETVIPAEKEETPA